MLEFEKRWAEEQLYRVLDGRNVFIYVAELFPLEYSLDKAVCTDNRLSRSSLVQAVLRTVFCTLVGPLSHQTAAHNVNQTMLMRVNQDA